MDANKWKQFWVKVVQFKSNYIAHVRNAENHPLVLMINMCIAAVEAYDLLVRENLD